jgi:hypothetical protein
MLRRKWTRKKWPLQKSELRKIGEPDSFTPMPLRKHAIVLLLILAVYPTRGQDEGFTATAPAAVSVGEQFQYVIEGSKQGDVLLPELDGFQLLAGPFSSYSSHSQWINGKMTMETVVTYTHILRATRQGELTIPPATIRVSRKEYQTNPVLIRVAEGEVQPEPAVPDPTQQEQADPSAGDGTTEPVFLRIIPSKNNVYVGEQFVSGLKVFTRVNTRPASAAKDIPYEGFYKSSLDPDASAQRQDISGQQYVTQVIQRHILIPQKPGDIVIEPYESDWMVQQVVQRNNSIFDSFFDDPFFSGVQEVPTTITTRPVTIHVKSLPGNAPRGFTGGVGNFSIQAEISAREIAVNEALTLKVTVTGTGNLPLLGDPEVNLPPDHDVYDVNRKLNTTVSGNVLRGSVTFEFPIVARHAGKYRIAPVFFSWFDPAAKKYMSASTSEFTFTVVKGDSEEGQGAVYIPGTIREGVRNIGTDIRDIVRTTPVMVPLNYTLFGAGWYKWLYFLALLLTLAVIVLIRTVSRRNADLRLIRNRQASRSARRRLKKADHFRRSGEEDRFYEEVGKAIWGYLADKLAIETSELSRDVILDELAGRSVGEGLCNEISRILDESEYSRFAPSSAKSDHQQLYRDAVQLIKNLENELK